MSLSTLTVSIVALALAQAPDEGTPAPVAPLAHPADAYQAAGQDAPLSPSEVVRALHDAAANKDEAGFRQHLTSSFQGGMVRLQSETLTEGHPYAWSVSMQALAAQPLVKVQHNQFYERASVFAETADGRAIKFRLALEDGHWRVVMPAPLVAELARRLEAQEENPAVDALSSAASSQPAASEPASQPSAPAIDANAPLVIAPPPRVAQADDDGLFAPGRITHYALYLPDYLFIGASAAMLAFRGFDRITPINVLIGPDYRPDAPDAVTLFDPRLDNTIGRPYVQEKVNPYVIMGAGLGTLVAAGGLDAVVNRDFHHTHALVVGGLTAGLATYDLTETTKILVGRLRPDFRDRYVRSACAGRVVAADGLNCDAAPQDGFVISAETVRDGMKSFPSGHSSVSFSLATYFSMYLGGEYIWGKHANIATAPLAAMAAGGMFAGAAFVAGSRVSDNRHHLEDVAVGAALGTGVSLASYLLHFDLDGEARWRTLSLGTFSTPDKGGGVTLAGQF